MSINMRCANVTILMGIFTLKFLEGGRYMRRRGLTRVVALVTMVSMLSCEFVAYATEDAATVTDENTESVTNEDEDTSEDDAAADDNTADDDAVEDADNEETTDETTEDESDDSSESDEPYVNERLELIYSKVSKTYTYKEYTGKTITIPITEAFVADESTAELKKGDFGDKTDKDAASINIDEVLTLKVTAPSDGLYNLGIEYISGDEDSILVPQMVLTLNGKTPFFEANTLKFEDLWQDPEEPSYDRYDNEIVAVPNKLMVWQKKYISDSSYRHSGPLKLQLDEGENIITLTMTEGSLLIGDITLEADEEIPEYQTGNTASGDEYVEPIEAERPFSRNDPSIRPTCEYNIDLTPYNYKKKTLNIIDAASFNDAGMTMTYKMNVPADGYYYVAFHYRQDSKTDMPVFMDVRVDGSIPNTELQSYAFDYQKSFENMTLTGSDGEKMALYFTEGEHTLSITISNDNIRHALETVDVIMSEISDLSLEITKVVGSNQDKWRKIDITEYVPDVEKRMQNWIDELNEIYDELAQYSTEEDDIGALAGIRKAVNKLESLLEDTSEIPARVTELSTSTSSATANLANFITEITANNISIDQINVYQEGHELEGSANIFVKIWESIKRFISSFTSQAYSTDNVVDTHLQVWINRPRQYLEIIQSLVDSTFTKETGIEVDLCIMPDAQKLILSNAAGNAPDVAQAVNYDQPFEFALRDAAVDMTKFDDYKEVFSQFEEGLLVPYLYDDPNDDKDTAGIYGMPETFYFYVMFYRTDVLNKLNIEVPQTWEEVAQILPELKNRGLNFFHFSESTTGTRTLAMTAPFFYQYGASMYDDVCTGETTLNSDAGVDAFTTLTELYTIYDLPTGIGSMYQHFRNGDMPIGVADYFMYSLLINAAPEIQNSWEISLVPGVEDEDGNIQRQTAGAAQASLIMKNGNETPIELVDTDGDKTGETMDREQAAWEYLKWWMSTETQVDFGNILQTTYGKEYIWNTANTEAFSLLPWDSTDKKIILESMEWIEETPRIPGTYMVERELSNAYVEVALNGQALRTALDEAVKRINRETKRKLQEFGYLDNEGNVVREYIVPDIDMVKELLGTD